MRTHTYIYYFSYYYYYIIIHQHEIFGDLGNDFLQRNLVVTMISWRRTREPRHLKAVAESVAGSPGRPFPVRIQRLLNGHVRAILQGISPQNMARNMVLTYLHVLDPGIPIELQIYSEANDQWEFHGPIHGGMLVPYIYMYIKQYLMGMFPKK